MKIIIDDTGSIHEWENGNVGKQIVSERQYSSVIDRVVQDVLTDRQYGSYLTSDTKRIFTLSKRQTERLLNHPDVKSRN